MRTKSNLFICRNKVDYWLNEKEISRQKLAELLGKKDVRTIYGWFQKTNQHPITESDARKLAKILGVDFIDVISRDDFKMQMEVAQDFTAWNRDAIRTLLSRHKQALPFPDNDPNGAEWNDIYCDRLIEQIIELHKQNLKMLELGYKGTRHIELEKQLNK